MVRLGGKVVRRSIEGSRLGRRPDLWLEALRAYAAHVRLRWWARPPFLPIPDGRYLAWRRETVYGDPRARIEAADLVAYLEWRRRLRRAAS